MRAAQPASRSRQPLLARAAATLRQQQPQGAESRQWAAAPRVLALQQSWQERSPAAACLHIYCALSNALLLLALGSQRGKDSPRLVCTLMLLLSARSSSAISRLLLSGLRSDGGRSSAGCRRCAKEQHPRCVGQHMGDMGPKGLTKRWAQA